MTSINRTIFKAYDVRATVDQLAPEVVHLIGRAAGSLARERGFTRIAVARDGRLSSPALAEALIAGLLACGIDVFDLGMAATPILYFAANRHANGCGVMITGSHNPPEYNGIKLLLGGDTLDGTALQALCDRIEADDFIAGAGSVRPLDVEVEYLAAVIAVILPASDRNEMRKRRAGCANSTASADDKISGLSEIGITLDRPLKVVIDCGNGVPGIIAPALFSKLGCEVVPLYCEVDGHFPNHHPDPQNPANLGDLQKLVVGQGADVGLAFDGDGDRLGVVTQSGAIIAGDTLLMLFAAAELAIRPGLVLYDVKSSRLVARWVAEHGGTSQAIPTGHSHMKRALKTSGALLAGELSGHFAFAGWSVDDALFAGAKLLQMIAAGVDLDVEFATLPQSLATPELQIMLNDDGHATVARIAETASFPSAERVFTLDGLRIEYADGFGLIRASNTTPVLTLRIEADHSAALHRIHDELAAAIAPLPMPELD